MQPGQLRYSTMCNERGGIVDDVTVYKFDEEHFMIVTSSGPRLKTYRWIFSHAQGASAYATDMTAAIALPVVQGLAPENSSSPSPRTLTWTACGSSASLRAG